MPASGMYIDELRISRVVRYAEGAYNTPIGAFTADDHTLGLYGHSGVKPNALALGYKSAKGVFGKINLTNRLKMLYNERITVADIISVTAPFRVTDGDPGDVSANPLIRG